jgi:uncharacterized protein YjiS (DUF1127 family)
MLPDLKRFRTREEEGMTSVPGIPMLGEDHGPHRAGVASTRALLGEALLWPARIVRARREFARIAALSDRELRDIGLMRHDLRNATALPLDEDPTRYLASVVTERRQAARRRPGARPLTGTDRRRERDPA